MMKKGRYSLRNLLKATVRNYKTKEVMFYIDYGLSAEEDWKANETVVRGGDGAPTRIIYNDSNDGTLKISTEIFTMDQLAMLSGSELTVGASALFKNEILKVVEDTTTTPSTFYVSLKYAPIDSNGDGTVDDKDVQVREFTNGVQGDKVTVVSVDTVAKKAVLSGVAAGDEVHVFYQRMSSVNAVSTTKLASDFPEYVEIIGDALFADEILGDFVAGQVFYPKTKVQPNYKLSYNTTGNATQLDMTFNILAALIDGKDTMCIRTMDDTEE